MPSSTSIITAAAVTGLVREAMRNSESLAIGAEPSMSTEPTATTSTSSPRATRPTAPGTVPSSTYRFRVACRVSMERPSGRDGTAVHDGAVRAVPWRSVVGTKGRSVVGTTVAAPPIHRSAAARA